MKNSTKYAIIFLIKERWSMWFFKKKKKVEEKEVEEKNEEVKAEVKEEPEAKE